MNKTNYLSRTVSRTAIVLIASASLACAQVTLQVNSNSLFGASTALVSGTNLTASIVSTSPLLLPSEPSYLRLMDTGSGSGTQGILVTPTSAAHSLDGWFTPGSTDKVNGALDFFFRDSVGSANWTNSGADFRPIDVGGGNNGGMRMVINCPTTNQLQVDFSAKNSSGAYVQHIYAADYSVSVAANAVYHLGVTASTNATSGIITIKLFLAPGDAVINTASSQYLIGTGTTTAALSNTGTNAITSAFNTASGFTFGQVNNASDSKTLDFDYLRSYNSVPSTFSAASYLPPLAATTPSGNPPLPANADSFITPFSATAPAANTPIMAEWTRTANPGDGMALSGNNFSTASMTSTNYGSDSSFIVYGESSNSVITPPAPAGIRRLSNNGISSAALELPPTLPTPSMYIMWPQNANGPGAPIVVNQAEAWWIGPNIHASQTACLASGQPASVYGRNFQLGTSVAPEVWVQQANATTGYVATITSSATYNPYKIDFTIPSACSNGSTYQVWVHNGHGGAYGWSLCAQPLVLTAPISWSQTVNVPSATGNASTDTANVSAALSNASKTATLTSGVKVSFPAGNYAINSGLTVPPNVELVGVGPTTQLIDSGNNVNMLNFSGTNSSVSNMQLATSSTNTGTFLLHGSLSNGAGQGSYFTNVTLSGTNNSSQQLVYLGPCQNTYFQNCTFIGGGLIPYSGNQLFFDGCTFKTMFDSLTINLGGGMNGFDITNSTVGNNGTWTQEALTSNATMTSTNSNMVTLASASGVAVGDTVRSASGNIWYDTISAVNGAVITMNNPITGAPEYPSNADAPNGQISIFDGTNVGQGIFVKGLNNSAARTNLYYGNNILTNFADPCSIDNWGEVISFEGNCGQFYGSPTSVSGSAMTFTTQATASGTNSITTPNQQLLAIITAGTGLGQTRAVSSYALSGSNTLTASVATPWNLPPDASSTVAIGEYVNNVAIYDNTFGGEAYFAKTDTNLHGAVLAAGVTQMVIDGNTMNYTDSGMDVNGQGQRDETAGHVAGTAYLQPANHMQPEYFDLVTNNTINGSFGGIALGGGGEMGNSTFPTVPAVYDFGQIYRQNTITSPILAGVFDFSSNQPTGTIPTNEMLLMDDNTFTTCPSGVFFSQINGYTTSSQQGDTLFTGNSFTFGGVDPGIRNSAYGDPDQWANDWTSSVSLAVAFDDNSYSGFSKGNYSSTTLGAVLEEPMRSFSESASKTLVPSVSDALVLWNDGDLQANWTTSVTYGPGASGWLSAVTGSGSISDEATSGVVNFTCNSSGISTPGTYTAFISSTANSTTRTAEVTFVVAP